MKDVYQEITDSNESRHRQLAHFVVREVRFCVSDLVRAAAPQGEELYEVSEHWVVSDPIEYQRIAWYAPLTEEGYRYAVQQNDLDIGDCDTWEEAFDLHNLDPIEYQREVSEHWVVSDWLADRL